MQSGGRTLVIETATEACSIALFDGQDLVAHDHRVLGRGHAERLIPMIEGLPANGRADHILVSLGPGSFTGVRIGIAAARALAIAWGAKVRGYPTLALVAQMALADKGIAVTVCMHGGHEEWFVENFSADGVSALEIASLTPEQTEKYGICSYAAGNRARELADQANRHIDVFEALPNARYADLLTDQHLSNDLSPIYGRAPDAVFQAHKKAKA